MGVVNPGGVGSHDLSPSLSQFQVREMTWLELLDLSHKGAWGDIEKPKHDMAFLLIVPDKTVKGERVFSLVAVWLHPHQAHHSSLGEAVWKLALLIDTGTDWAYTFMQLNEDALHIPLSSEGHIRAMINGVPSRSTCGCLGQLEVCRLLQCGNQVLCPKGLNWGLEPIQFSLPEPPVWDMDTLGKPACKPWLLKVDLSSVKLRDQMPIASAPHRASTPPSPLHSAMECPSETATSTSMAAKLQELLSQAMLDTSGSVPGNTTLRRSASVALDSPPSIGVEDPLSIARADSAMPKLMAPSSQVSQQAAMPNDTLNTMPISHSPSLHPVSKTLTVASIPCAAWSEAFPRADPGALSKEVLRL